jgi:hypothetical protein
MDPPASGGTGSRGRIRPTRDDRDEVVADAGSVTPPDASDQLLRVLKRRGPPLRPFVEADLPRADLHLRLVHDRDQLAPLRPEGGLEPLPDRLRDRRGSPVGGDLELQVTVHDLGHGGEVAPLDVVEDVDEGTARLAFPVEPRGVEGVLAGADCEDRPVEVRRTPGPFAELDRAVEQPAERRAHRRCHDHQIRAGIP